MIDVRDLSLRAGTFRLHDVRLHVAEGEYFVLMGRTGSGKTLLVRSICGLTRPGGGAILIDGRDVSRMEPRDRDVGYMPQDCGLFPHLTVLKNVLFSLRARGMRKAAALRSAAPIIEMLGIEYLLKRRTQGLSGGERQKVALARALAGRPKVLLLDEPVSALDEPARREVCAELRRVQKHLGISTVHVCHSLTEARSVADRVGVMHEGTVDQVGTIHELTASPATDAVTRLMGIPAPPE